MKAVIAMLDGVVVGGAEAETLIDAHTLALLSCRALYEREKVERMIFVPEEQS